MSKKSKTLGVSASLVRQKTKTANPRWCRSCGFPSFGMRSKDGLAHIEQLLPNRFDLFSIDAPWLKVKNHSSRVTKHYSFKSMIEKSSSRTSPPLSIRTCLMRRSIAF